MDTLDNLREEIIQKPLCLLLGSDAFRDFPQWRQPERILQQAHLIIMQRPGEDHPDYYPERVTDDPTALESTRAGRILFQTVTQLEISSTAIREMLKRGDSPRYLLPDPVLDIIQREGLYGWN